MEISIQNTNTSSEIESQEKKNLENQNLKDDINIENEEIEKKEINEQINENEVNIQEKGQNIKEEEKGNGNKEVSNKEYIDENKELIKEDENNDNNNIDSHKDENNIEEKNIINQQSEIEIQYSYELEQKVKKYDVQRMPDNYDKENANFKVLFLGDSGVGKSSLVIRGTSKKYDTFYKPTVGFDLLNYNVRINDTVIKLQIWDTCGQEEFSMCNQSLYKNASIAIMVYSIDNKKSYENIKKWVSRVKDLSKENTIFFLVGNKNDLNNKREVPFLEGKKYGNENFQFFVETSSKNESNVNILFKEIAIYLYENRIRSESSEYKGNESNIDEYFDGDQSSSFLNSYDSTVKGKNKKCLKCC